MKNLCLILFALLGISTATQAQSPREAGRPAADVQELRAAQTIEGYWQDAARRVLFMRDAPASAVYGTWATLDPKQTYPLAKHIRKSGAAYDLTDLNYDDNHAIKILNAKEDGIEFVRLTKGSACGMRHLCRLSGDELFCSLENICREAGRDVLDWRGEERYVKRQHCERVGRTEAQGIPVNCR